MWNYQRVVASTESWKTVRTQAKNVLSQYIGQWPWIPHQTYKKWIPIFIPFLSHGLHHSCWKSWFYGHTPCKNRMSCWNFHHVSIIFPTNTSILGDVKWPSLINTQGTQGSQGSWDPWITEVSGMTQISHWHLIRFCIDLIRPLRIERLSQLGFHQLLRFDEAKHMPFGYLQVSELTRVKWQIWEFSRNHLPFLQWTTK